MNIRFILSSLFMTIVTAIVLTACERHGARDLQSYIQEVRTTEGNKKRQNLMTEIKPPVAVAYQGGKLRSPFSEVESVAGPGMAANPLLAYPLNVLRFVGTLSQENTAFAFIMTPDNMVYQVKVGDAIGDHAGKVISIQSNRLNVMEQDAEEGSTPMQRIVTLELKEGQ